MVGVRGGEAQGREAPRCCHTCLSDNQSPANGSTTMRGERGLLDAMWIGLMDTTPLAVEGGLNFSDGSGGGDEPPAFGTALATLLSTVQASVRDWRSARRKYMTHATLVTTTRMPDSTSRPTHTQMKLGTMGMLQMAPPPASPACNTRQDWGGGGEGESNQWWYSEAPTLVNTTTPTTTAAAPTSS